MNHGIYTVIGTFSKPEQGEDTQTSKPQHNRNNNKFAVPTTFAVILKVKRNAKKRALHNTKLKVNGNHSHIYGLEEQFICALETECSDVKHV